VIAIVSIVLAALMIGFGIAQRTLFLGPDHVTGATTISSQATVTVIDGATLNSFDRSQTITARGSGTIFAAYGRTSDVVAWIGKASYNAVTFDAKSQSLVSTTVAGTETEVPDPKGSDLWLADYTEKNELDFTINVPEDISVIMLSDGVKPAPANVSVTWLLDNSTPFAGPLVVGGAIVLLIGLAFLLWAVNHVRRARGPRRKQPKLPKVPRKPTYKPVKKGANQPAALTRGRRSAGMVAAPSIVIGALLLTGCTPSSALLDDSSAVLSGSSSSSDTGDDPSTLDIPAVTEPQARRIVTRISETIAKADTDMDADLAKTRLDGPALALRLGNYAIRKVKADTLPPSAIPSTRVKVTLPQRNNSWPRTVFVVVEGDDEKVAPQALILIQDDPRSQYKVHYAVALEPGTVLPKVASANIGTNRLDPGVKLLAMAPIDVAVAYGDILENDVDSEFYDLFKVDGDTLRVAVGKVWRDAQKAQLATTAQLAFSEAIGEGQVIVLDTNEHGGLVAVELKDIETIRPTEVGAAITAPPEVAALLGKTLSTKGLTATYGDQLLFYIPPATTGGKIILLGYSSGLLGAVELP
jgi:hypothetical protein